MIKIFYEKRDTFFLLTIITMIPLLWMSNELMPFAFLGVTLVIDVYPVEDIPILDEPERTSIDNFYNAIFTIYPSYLLGMTIWLLIFLPLMVLGNVKRIWGK